MLRRMDVLLLDSCCPMELNMATLTYVSEKKAAESKFLPIAKDHDHHMIIVFVFSFYSIL